MRSAQKFLWHHQAASPNFFLFPAFRIFAGQLRTTKLYTAIIACAPSPPFSLDPAATVCRQSRTSRPSTLFFLSLRHSPSHCVTDSPPALDYRPVVVVVVAFCHLSLIASAFRTHTLLLFVSSSGPSHTPDTAPNPLSHTKA